MLPTTRILRPRTIDPMLTRCGRTHSSILGIVPMPMVLSEQTT